MPDGTESARAVRWLRWHAGGVPELIALQLPGGPVFVEAVQRAWDDGNAVLPLPPNPPAPHLQSLLAATRPSRLIDASGEEFKLDDSVPTLDGDAVVIATSGTTGTPKGVVHSTQSVQAAAYATAVATGVEPDVRWLACLPLWHVGGFSVVTRALISGLGLDVLPGFDAAEVDSAADAGATHVSLVPAALSRVDASLWRRILLGGSAIPAYRPANSTATYGMTETMGGVVYDGLALPGVSVRIVDADVPGRDAPPGMPGPIEIAGPMLLRAYRSDTPDGTDPVDPKGWYRTGDLGSIDESGILSVDGRADDVINTGGEKVWPATVEAILERDDRVSEAAVVGVADRDWGQRVVAVVVPADPAAPPPLEPLRDLVRTQLPSYCAPKELVVVDSLPRTDLGKIQRRRIADSYTELGPT